MFLSPLCPARKLCSGLLLSIRPGAYTFRFSQFVLFVTSQQFLSLFFNLICMDILSECVSLHSFVLGASGG